MGGFHHWESVKVEIDYLFPAEVQTLDHDVVDRNLEVPLAFLVGILPAWVAYQRTDSEGCLEDPSAQSVLEKWLVGVVREDAVSAFFQADLLGLDYLVEGLQNWVIYSDIY